jgi:hypothetical protein
MGSKAACGAKCRGTMPSMTVARAWGRQLFAASTAALIVPSTMLAAVLVLALGGGFGSVGVLGQLFSGPSLPGVGGGAPGGAHGGSRGLVAASLPVVRAVTAPRPVSLHTPSSVPHVPPARGGTRSGGGAIGGTGGTGVRPVTQGTGGSGSGASPPRSSPPPSSPAPSPPPTPSPQPTPVDTVVKVVTSVTQQVPAPVGPAATQTLQAVGGAVDNPLPQTGQP